MAEHYLVGTKYGERNNVNILPELIRREVIAIGFSDKTDLSEFYCQNPEGLRNLLRGRGEKSKNISQLIRFMSLKEGDIIALKSTGSPLRGKPYLEIVAFAVVKSKNGKVYVYDPGSLGHTLNVEFIDYDFKKSLEIGGYGQSIHHLQNPKYLNAINTIFEAYKWADSSASKRKGTDTKRTDDIELLRDAGKYIRTSAHNRIQQDIYNRLVEEFGREHVSMEENYVDLLIRQDSSITIAEVKPYHSARQCIIEGLGQLLGYYEGHYRSDPNVQLLIIGAAEPSKQDIQFIEFIKASLSYKFEYNSWERIKKHGIRQIIPSFE